MGLLQSPHMVLDAPYLVPVVLLCYYRLVVLLSSLAVVTPSFCSLAWVLWFTLFVFSASAPVHIPGLPPTSAPVHIPGLPPPPSYPELSMRLASAERDNERLRTEIAQLHSELGRYDDIIIGAIAPRSDALHRQRALADGIICGCCALRRLPDSFFPAVLAVGTATGLC